MRLRQVEGQLHELQSRMSSLADLTKHPVEGSKSPVYAKKIALVIGINRYKDARFPPLRYAESDARAVSSELIAEGFEVRSLLGDAATRTKILSELEQDALAAGQNDLLLVYFTGLTTAHGDSSNKSLLMFPTDASSDYSEAISVKAIRKLMEESPALHKLLVVDGCGGTTGFVDGAIGLSPAPSSKPNESIFSFLAGTQDSEFGL